MKSIVFFLLALSQIIMNAQDPDALWLRHTCGYMTENNFYGGNVWGDAVCADNFGNSYNSGSFSGFWFTMDTIIDMNMNRFYINKYDEDGERIWTVGAQGTTINSIMTSSRMECDDDGNIYVCGTFGVDDSVYMAPNWYPIGSGYIAKYDTEGNNLWCRFAGRTGSAAITIMDMSIANDQIFACGIMSYGNQEFGGISFENNQSQSGLIFKLDSDGNILESKMLDPNVTNELYGIEVSEFTGKVYAVGETINGAINVDGISSGFQANATNSVIIKMDNNLQTEWIRRGTTELNPLATWGSGEKCLSNIELDQFDNIYAIGNGNGNSTQFGNLSFDHLINGGYMQDVYIVKYNTYGEEKWIRYGQSAENDYVRDIITDEFGNSVISVWSGSNALGSFNFDGQTIQQWYGGLVKYDPDGNVLYTQQLQENRSLAQLADGIENTFFATGNGISYGMPYDELNISDCEEEDWAESSVDFKMIHVKFFDDNFVESTSIKETKQTVQLELYPNPASRYFEIKASDYSSEAVIDIIDSNGRLIKRTENEYQGTIDIQDLSQGLYFVRITDKSGLYKIGRLIKN